MSSKIEISTIDFHCHSNYSDGQLSPFDLFQRAYDKGIRTIALTDHDTVAGIPDAKKAS